jgi:hypothetical protein
VSLQQFVEKALSDNKAYVEELRKLSEILDLLSEDQEKHRIYAISVTSNT